MQTMNNHEYYDSCTANFHKAQAWLAIKGSQTNNPLKRVFFFSEYKTRLQLILHSFPHKTRLLTRQPDEV